MNFRFVSKKFIVISIIILVILILSLGEFFYWLKWKKDNQERTLWSIENMESKYFKVEGTAEGKIMTNKKAGLTVGVPTGWDTTNNGQGISFYSPDVKFAENGALIFQSIKDGGCAVNVQVIKCLPNRVGIPTDADDLRNFIACAKDKSYNPNDRKVDILTVSGKDGLRTSYADMSGENIGKMLFEIPVGQTIYSFNSGFIFSDKCVEDFNNFIKNISIK